MTMPPIMPELPGLEAMLPHWREALGADYTAYRNHLYRMLHFFRGFNGAGGEAEACAVVAACFHDLGIWTDHTFDYIEPSAALAQAWLTEHDHQDWARQVLPMVREHHKLSPYRQDAAVEAFRRADLVDVSLGLVRFGLPAGYVDEVRRTFPNAGFHRRLLQLGGRRLLSHPWSPMPMMKW
jgi:hypothetical protein